MTKLGDLRYHQQIYHLRDLAKQFLQKYSFVVKKMQLINHGENATFLVETAKPSQKAVLRIHRLDYHNKDGILNELSWLSALAQDTNFEVPTPILGKDKKALQSIYWEKFQEERNAVLFSWVSGSFRYKSLQQEHMTSLGSLMAHLQQHATKMKWKNFSRPCWDLNGLLGNNPLWGNIPKSIQAAKPKQRKFFLKFHQEISEKIKDYGTKKNRFGVIHADLHLGNVIFNGKTAQAIDFDDFGQGYYTYDLAISMSAIANHKKNLLLAESLMTGYQKVKKLHQLDQEMIAVFMLARRFLMLAWIQSRADNPDIIKYLPESIQHLENICKTYQNNELVIQKVLGSVPHMP